MRKAIRVGNERLVYSIFIYDATDSNEKGRAPSEAASLAVARSLFFGLLLFVLLCFSR